MRSTVLSSPLLLLVWLSLSLSCPQTDCENAPPPHRPLLCPAATLRPQSAITRGCIPVIIMDGIKVDWEDELPMQEFAIRMPFM